VTDKTVDDSAIFDPGKAPPKATFTARWPLTLKGYSGVPVHPPVALKEGETVELWWVIEAGEIRYGARGESEGVTEPLFRETSDNYPGMHTLEFTDAKRGWLIVRTLVELGRSNVDFSHVLDRPQVVALHEALGAWLASPESQEPDAGEPRT
jgi:hypothetical protein